MLIKKVTVKESVGMWRSCEELYRTITTTYYFLGIPFRKDTEKYIEIKSGSEHWGK